MEKKFWTLVFQVFSRCVYASRCLDFAQSFSNRRRQISLRLTRNRTWNILSRCATSLGRRTRTRRLLLVEARNGQLRPSSRRKISPSPAIPSVQQAGEITHSRRGTEAGQKPEVVGRRRKRRGVKGASATDARTCRWEAVVSCDADAPGRPTWEGEGKIFFPLFSSLHVNATHLFYCKFGNGDGVAEYS